MLTESEKNKVYFSQHLANVFPVVYRQLSEILTVNGVSHELLQNTKDYWCRDYMPVQYAPGHYVQFTYKPDYLQNPKDIKYQTQPEAVTETLGSLRMTIHRVPLNMDGGNFVFCKGRDTNYLVMNEKVMVENRPWERHVIEGVLRAAFECPNLQILWLPWEGKDEDMTGHADGAVRYVGIGESGKPKVLACLDVYSHDVASCMYDILAEHFEVEELHINNEENINLAHDWAAINSLQTDKVIIVPGVGNKRADAIAMEKMKALYPQYEGRIYQVRVDKLMKGGGALNCCSWTVNDTIIHNKLFAI